MAALDVVARPPGGSKAASSRHAAAASTRRRPHALGDAGEVRGAERGRLPDRGPAHGHAEQVGLELAEQVHDRGAAVDAQLGERSTRGRRHRVDDVAGLQRHRLDDGARDVRPAGAARDAEDRAAGVRVPPR